MGLKAFLLILIMEFRWDFKLPNLIQALKLLTLPISKFEGAFTEWSIFWVTSTEIGCIDKINYGVDSIDNFNLSSNPLTITLLWANNIINNNLAHSSYGCLENSEMNSLLNKVLTISCWF